MGHKKPRRKPFERQAITRRGLRIYQKGDQIKTLGVKRPDVASLSTDGNRYWVWFELESPTCECAYHTTAKKCRC